MTTPEWLAWARRLQAIAQSGLTYCKDKFDIQRYNEIRNIAAEMMAAGVGSADFVRIADIFAQQSGYATPKIDVRVAAFNDARILLVRELEDGCWTLPGGWADVGEPASVAAAREAREESGYEVRITKLAAVFDRDLHNHPPYPFHTYKMFFIATLAGGAPRDSNETADAQFFPENHLPPLSTTRVTPSQIAHLFEHFRHPDLPTSFD
ncbi:MAG TPA: NUDIX hydrolase [Candidatus Eremiobacteraceae bacterium]|nr:NUDIX hydrolase [Candidatus Eremiobacteraceae bacterium]